MHFKKLMNYSTNCKELRLIYGMDFISCASRMEIFKKQPLGQGMDIMSFW